jgi:regulator of sirC expression with transglutaminase-like and TPR domain
MVTRNRLAPIVAGLFVGLLAQQASATEEIVVYGSAAAAVKVDPAVFRAEIDNYVRTLSSELRTTLDQDSKRMPVPKLELASNTTTTRG